MSVEVLEKEGFSLDVGTTTKDAFVGISKDIVKSALMEADAGLFLSSRYKDLMRRKLNPELNVGLSIMF